MTFSFLKLLFDHHKDFSLNKVYTLMENDKKYFSYFLKPLLTDKSLTF